MAEVVLDTNILNETLNHINRIMKDSRGKLDEIVSRNTDVSSYEELSKSKDLMRLYGDCADDYSKLSYLQTGVSEAMMDLRSVRRQIVKEQTSLPPSIVKSYKFRIDQMIEELGLFKEAIHSSRQGMEARVRYFNSCAYSSYDRIMGAKC